MFDLFNFHVLQCRHIKAVMTTIASFRPDGKEPENVQDFIDEGNAAKDDLADAIATRDLAHSQLNQAVSDGHAACVKVHPIMKSRFRKDPASLDRISKLPTVDQSIAQTIARMTAMSNLWAHLPNPPGTITPFKAWGAMGRTEFDALLTTIKTKLEDLPTIDEAFEEAQAQFHAKDHAMEDFIAAALIEGRGQFDKGTPERENIDAIPVEPPQQPPGKAFISDIASEASQQASLKYTATHGTSFDILHKGPGMSDFETAAHDRVEHDFVMNGLAFGRHTFKVIAHNSRGDGPESDPRDIDCDPPT